MAYIGSSPVLAQGDAGNGIDSTSYDSSTGVLTITFDDGTVTTTSDIRGSQGATGNTGDTGATGNGISSSSYSSSTGIITLTFTDNTTSTTGDLRGADGTNGTNGTDGSDGNGIASGSYNSSTGVVTITFDDGTSTTTDDLRGADGTNGTDGADGADGEIDRTVDGSWSGSQRGTPQVVTDGTLILTDGNNFKYTPGAADVLEFTGETSSTGQSGFITIINSGHTISLGGEVKTGASWDVSTAGTYLVSYYCDGTSVYVSASEALA